MIDNKFHYTYNNPSYKKIFFKIKRIKKKCIKEKKEIDRLSELFLQNYSKELYCKFSKQQQLLLTKYLKKILDIFPQLYDNKVIVFLHGSYAIGLNRIASDVDINYVYDDKLKEKLFCIEELIAYCISYVFDISDRDHIHNMMIYNVDSKTPFLKYNNYKIIFRDGNEIKYNVRKTKTHLVNKIYKSSRNYSDFLYYIEKNFTQIPINEWCYSFIGIQGYYNHSIKSDLDLIRQKQHIMNSYYVKAIKEEIKKIKKGYVSDSRNHYIRNLNLEYKKYYLNILKNYLVIFHELKNIKKPVNLNNMLSELNDEGQIDDHIIKYIWLLMRIENICSIYKIDFSYKSNDQTSYKAFTKYYYQQYGDSVDLDINRVMIELKRVLISSYERMIDDANKSYDNANKTTA